MLFIRISQGTTVWLQRWLESGERAIIVPLFEGETYEIEVYGKGGELLKGEKILAKREGIFLTLPKGKIETKILSKEDIVKFIKELITKKFDDELKEQLALTKSMYPDAKLNEKQIRGGRLEHLIWLYLQKMRIESIIDSAIWSGKVSDYGLAYPASGKPDILVYIDNIVIVLEVTIIPDIRMQWSAEGASVPDHVKTFALQNPEKKVIGLFVAPSIHHQLKKNLDTQAKVDRLPMLSITMEEFLFFLSIPSRTEFKNRLIKIVQEQLPSF